MSHEQSRDKARLVSTLVLSMLCFERAFAADALQTPAQAQATGLSLVAFDIDATPPIGSMLAYDPDPNKWDLGLRGRGVVLQGAGQPIVLCAIAWIGITNCAHDAFRRGLSQAAGTT